MFKHHRVNNIFPFNIGFDSHDKEGDAFLAKHDQTCYEAMYLRKGDSEVEEEMFARNKQYLGDVEDVEVQDKRKVPQGQYDVDHCLHRSRRICNSIYVCFPMSHTANTCNSYIRRRAKEWCYGLSNHKYTNGG